MLAWLTSSLLLTSCDKTANNNPASSEAENHSEAAGATQSDGVDNFAREDIGDYGRKGKNSRPIGSTYTELDDISKYPESPFAIAMADSMMREMKSFQKKRFQILIRQDTALLNNQEKEELKFYIDQVKLR